MKRVLGCTLLFMLVAVLSISCEKDKSQTAKTYVLVHGAWQGPYVWELVKQGLENGKNRVLVVELPAHGSDTTAPQKVSIDVYRDHVLAIMNKVSEKVILVGHSMGGMVISAVAEKTPNKIEKLVFIGAFVPADGQSLLDLATQDHQSHLGSSLIPSADQLTLDVKRDSIIPVFCHDAPRSIQQVVVSKFRVEPAIPFTNKASLTNNGFGKVDKYYIHTLQDRAVGINLQRKMAAAAQIKKTDSLNTSHSPFLSQPMEVVNILKKIGR